MQRELTWIESEKFHGWGCSGCAWKFKPLGPAIGNSIIAMTFDFEKQRDQEFKSHDCQTYSIPKPKE